MKILEVPSFWLPWEQGGQCEIYLRYSRAMSRYTGHALAWWWMRRWSYAAFRETILLFSVFAYFLIIITCSVKWNHQTLQPCGFKNCMWVCKPFSFGCCRNKGFNWISSVIIETGRGWVYTGTEGFVGEEFLQNEEHPFSQMALRRMKINITAKPVSYCWKRLTLFLCLFVCLGFFHMLCDVALPPCFSQLWGSFFFFKITYWELNTLSGFILLPLPPACSAGLFPCVGSLPN